LTRAQEGAFVTKMRALSGALGQVTSVTMFFMRSSFGDTTGTVSMVLATAINSNAVNATLVPATEKRCEDVVPLATCRRSLDVTCRHGISSCPNSRAMIAVAWTEAFATIVGLTSRHPR
jgi:hypothetical protein